MGETLAALFFPLALFALTLWGLHAWSRGQDGYQPAAGVVPESDLEPDAMAPVIGSYHGNEIREWVCYRGERYEFAHVAAPRYRVRVKPGELYLPPGLVYRRV